MTNETMKPFPDETSARICVKRINRQRAFNGDKRVFLCVVKGTSEFVVMPAADEMANGFFYTIEF